MKQTIRKTQFNIRTWLANLLVKLAYKIRPKEITEFMKTLEESFIFGNGMGKMQYYKHVPKEETIPKAKFIKSYKEKLYEKTTTETAKTSV